MNNIGVWQVGNDDSPRRLHDDRGFLEKHLDPSA